MINFNIDIIKEKDINEFYILGSGASMNYFSPYHSFFKNKFVIGINTIFKHYPVDLTIIQHHDLIYYIKSQNYPLHKLYISKNHKGDYNNTTTSVKGANIFKHNNQGYLNPLDFSVLDEPNKLLVGSTTAIAGISLAYKLGAKSIILCGIDGGMLDGQTNLKGYYQTENSGNKEKQYNHSKKTNEQIIQYRDELLTRGVNMYSLNPFVNIKYENHKIT